MKLLASAAIVALSLLPILGCARSEASTPKMTTINELVISDIQIPLATLEEMIIYMRQQVPPTGCHGEIVLGPNGSVGFDCVGGCGHGSCHMEGRMEGKNYRQWCACGTGGGGTGGSKGFTLTIRTNGKLLAMAD